MSECDAGMGSCPDPIPASPIGCTDWRSLYSANGAVSNKCSIQRVLVSDPVSGILSRSSRSLCGHPSVRPTCGCTRRCGRAAHPTSRPCSGRGLPSRRGHPRRWCALTAPFHPHLCRRIPGEPAAIGGLLSVALSARSPPPGSRQHPALWSPDFPQVHRSPGSPATTRITHQRPSH